MTTTPYKLITVYFNNSFYIPKDTPGFEYNEIYRQNNWSITKPEAIEPLRNYAKNCDEYNNTLYAGVNETYQAYVKQFNSLFYPHKKDDKKLLAAFDAVKPPMPQSQLRKLEDYLSKAQANHKAMLEAELKKQREAAANFESIRLHTAAIEFIKNNSNHQYTFDYEKGEIIEVRFNQETTEVVQTFPISQAVKIANDLCFEQLKNEAGDDIDHSCCDDCSSWDPSNNRCSCGNRRMCWTRSGNFENMYIYPEAY